MKKLIRILFVPLLVCTMLTACGSPATQATQAMDEASPAVTQPTLAPTSTSTPEPTATSTSTPTETPIPTETPNLTATSAAGTQAARASSPNRQSRLLRLYPPSPPSRLWIRSGLRWWQMEPFP